RVGQAQPLQPLRGGGEQPLRAAGPAGDAARLDAGPRAGDHDSQRGLGAHADAPRNESASAMWSADAVSPPSRAAIVAATRRARSAPRPESSIPSTARSSSAAAAALTAGG